MQLLCTDSATAMAAKKSGLKSKVKSVTSALKWIDHMIHYDALVANKLQPDICNIFKDTVKIINYIKSLAVQNCCFNTLCEEMGTKHNLLHF